MPLSAAHGRLQSIPLQANSPRFRNTKNLPNVMEALGATRQCHRGQKIYGREDPVEQWYRVVSGMARKSTVLNDGRRRIVDFLLPGDYFGFSANDEHYFDVEVVVEGTILACYSRRQVEALADSDPEVSRHIRRLAMRATHRLQGRILILGYTRALEKVRAFLIEMGQRSQDGSSPVVVLPMSRYDIADYLAVSVETVSRALTTLKRRGVIALPDRHRVMVIDPGALMEEQRSRRVSARCR